MKKPAILVILCTLVAGCEAVFIIPL